MAVYIARMKLRDVDRGEFVAKGFASLSNVVPGWLVTQLIDGINETTFGSQHQNYGALRKDKRFETLEELSAPMRLLYEDYVRPVGDSLLGEGGFFTDAQYSVMEAGRPASKGWHIDGTWIATDKNSLDGIPFFKLLVGIYLTDLTKPGNGNLMVSPRGHNIVADFFKENGTAICESPKNAFEQLYVQPVPDLVPVLARPGDMIAAHALLPHTVSDNHGPDRPVIYFRLGAYMKSGFPALSDLWREWPASTH